MVTSLSDEIMTIAQHYRERADCENIFDELKNQWGWGGFTTQDMARCQIVARSVGLIKIFRTLLDNGRQHFNIWYAYQSALNRIRRAYL